MEDTPLSLAHYHALQASKILSHSAPSPTPATLAEAAASHGLAATSFASAAKTTKDPEAHRTLELLVAQHERWAAGLKQLAVRPAEKDPDSKEAGSPPLSAGKSSDREAATPKGSAGGIDKQRTLAPPVLPLANISGVPNFPARLQKSTSSLATNLASARGIPQPSSGDSLNARTNRRRIPSSVASTELTSSKPTTNPLTLLPPDGPQSPRDSTTLKPQTEETFSRFYSGLNSLIHRIGSPFTASLAFAGLPVGDDANDTRVPPDFLPKGFRGIDLGHQLPADIAGGESFYVVPISGGTMTYAGVVRRENAMGELSIRDHPAESVYSSSGTSRSAGKGKMSAAQKLPTVDERDYETAKFAGHQKTPEELQLENQTLRKTVEQLTRDMAKWQRKSRESQNVLQNSIMQLTKNPGSQSGIDILHQVQRSGWLRTDSNERGLTSGKGGGDVYSEGRLIGEIELIKEKCRARERELEDKVKRLEEEVSEYKGELEKTQRENEKLKKLVQKQKERWDQIREGARRRAAQAEAAAGPGVGDTGGRGEE